MDRNCFVLNFSPRNKKKNLPLSYLGRIQDTARMRGIVCELPKSQKTSIRNPTFLLLFNLLSKQSAALASSTTPMSVLLPQSAILLSILKRSSRSRIVWLILQRKTNLTHLSLQMKIGIHRNRGLVRIGSARKVTNLKERIKRTF